MYVYNFPNSKIYTNIIKKEHIIILMLTSILANVKIENDCSKIIIN